jgi:hypothetical protein
MSNTRRVLTSFVLCGHHAINPRPGRHHLSTVSANHPRRAAITLIRLRHTNAAADGEFTCHSTREKEKRGLEKNAFERRAMQN